MKELQLIESKCFGDVKCDIYGNEKDFYMTRAQIGDALEYSEASDAIRKIHERRKERLDKYSVQVKLSGTDGKLYNTYVYDRKGIMEICRHSGQPKADAFIDWVWEVMDGLISGRTKIITDHDKRLEVQVKNTEIRLKYAKLKEAEFISKGADKLKSVLSPEMYAVLQIQSLEAIIGQNAIPRPQLEQKLIDATGIAEKLGILSEKGNPHAQAVGAIINSLDIVDGEKFITVFDKNGHQGSTTQYTYSVLEKVQLWLNSNNWPKEITGNGKSYKVRYKSE